MRHMLLVILLLLMPAVVYGLTVDQKGNWMWGFDVRYFAQNYFYMAAPHILALMLFLFRFMKMLPLIRSLVVLNVFLALFKLWVLFFVSHGESGLAWVLYMPVAVVGSVLAYGVNRALPSEHRKYWWSD